jgi:hypothetical protein
MSREPRRIERPTEGTYTVRFVKGGPQVPVRLYQMEGGRWTADVNGQLTGYAYTPEQVEFIMMSWVLGGDRLNKEAGAFAGILSHARVIDQETYDRKLERLAWAKENAPEDSCLHPYDPIDLTKKASLW